MAIFDNFPYTNFHDLNLDWIIEQVKKYGSTIEEIDVELRGEIEDAIAYMQTNIVQTTSDIINEYIEEGGISVGVTYDPATEEMNIVITNQ